MAQPQQRITQIQVNPILPSNFKQPNDWGRWKRQLQQFRSASGLENDAAKQISMLLYCMDDEAAVVLSSTGIFDNQSKVSDAVLKKFDSSRSGTMLFLKELDSTKGVSCRERWVEQYILELYILAENWDYGNATSEMI